MDNFGPWSVMRAFRDVRNGPIDRYIGMPKPQDDERVDMDYFRHKDIPFMAAASDQLSRDRLR